MFRARPVGTGLGAKFGRKPAENHIQILIFITFPKLGDLWMWLQLMWLQFDVVRGPVGVARERSSTDLHVAARWPLLRLSQVTQRSSGSYFKIWPDFLGLMGEIGRAHV